MLKSLTTVPPEYYFLFLKRAFGLFKFHKVKSERMSNLLIKIFRSSSKLYLKSSFLKFKYQCRNSIIDRIEYSLRYLGLKVFLRRLFKICNHEIVDYFRKWKIRSQKSSSIAQFFITRSLNLKRTLILQSFRMWLLKSLQIRDKLMASSRIYKYSKRYNTKFKKSAFKFWSEKLNECKRKLTKVLHRFTSAYLLFLSIAFRQLTLYISHFRRVELKVKFILNDRWRDDLRWYFWELKRNLFERKMIRKGVEYVESLTLKRGFKRFKNRIEIERKTSKAIKTITLITKSQNMWNMFKALRKLKAVGSENFDRKNRIRRVLRKTVNDMYNSKILKAWGTWKFKVNNSIISAAIIKNGVRNIGRVNRLFLERVRSNSLNHWRRVVFELKNHNEILRLRMKIILKKFQKKREFELIEGFKRWRNGAEVLKSCENYVKRMNLYFERFVKRKEATEVNAAFGIWCSKVEMISKRESGVNLILRYFTLLSHRKIRKFFNIWERITERLRLEEDRNIEKNSRDSDNLRRFLKLKVVRLTNSMLSAAFRKWIDVIKSEREDLQNKTQALKIVRRAFGKRVGGDLKMALRIWKVRCMEGKRKIECVMRIFECLELQRTSKIEKTFNKWRIGTEVKSQKEENMNLGVQLIKDFINRYEGDKLKQSIQVWKSVVRFERRKELRIKEGLRGIVKFWKYQVRTRRSVLG